MSEPGPQSGVLCVLAWPHGEGLTIGYVPKVDSVLPQGEKGGSNTSDPTLAVPGAKSPASNGQRESLELDMRLF